MAQPPSGGEIAVPELQAGSPATRWLPSTASAARCRARGPSLLQTSRDRGEASRCSSVRSMTSPRSLVRRSMSWSARAITTSHCLTRLSLTVGLLGQPLAVGLHRVGFGHGVGAPAWLPAAPEACACRRGRCGRGWRPPPRRRARRPPARAGRRSRPAAGRPARRGWRCGRAGVSTARRAGRTAAAAASRVWANAGPAQRPAAGEATPGGWEKRTQASLLQSRSTTGSAGPSCRPRWGPNLGGFPRLFRVG